MRRAIGSVSLALALAALMASPSWASDASVRHTIRQFQPGLARAAAGLQSALKGKPTAAGYARLDAATRHYLATVKLDRRALQLQRAGTRRVAKGRTALLTALVRLSQAATSLDAAVQAAKAGHHQAAVRNLNRSVAELHLASGDEVRAVRLLSA